MAAIPLNIQGFIEVFLDKLLKPIMINSRGHRLATFPQLMVIGSKLKLCTTRSNPIRIKKDPQINFLEFIVI
jgi:hypothetical protein